MFSIELFIIGIISLLPIFLNRLRGTGLIKQLFTLSFKKRNYFNLFKWKFVSIPETEVKVNLVWNHIYALYVGIIFGFIFMDWRLGLATFIAYLIGESKGWGEWVGTLSSPEKMNYANLLNVYNDNEGKTFPFMHQIANFFIKEEKLDGTTEDKIKQYRSYATLAIILRGMYWWGLVYLTIAVFGYISYLEAGLITIFLGISFPVACYFGKKLKYKAVWFKKIHFSQGWENQEIFYGLFQGLAISYILVTKFI